MKKLAVLTAVALSTATGAFAMADSTTDLAEIQQYAPNADVSGLSDTEVLVLLNAIHNGDSESEKRNFVRSFLR